MHLLEEGKPSTPHGRRRRRLSGPSRLAALGRSELGPERGAYSGPSDSDSSDDTDDEVKQRRRATAQAIVSLPHGITVAFRTSNPISTTTAKTGKVRLKRRDSSAVGRRLLPSLQRGSSSYRAHTLPIERSFSIAPSLARL